MAGRADKEAVGLFDNLSVGGAATPRRGPLTPVYATTPLRMAMDLAFAKEGRVGQVAKRARRVNPRHKFAVHKTVNPDGTVSVSFSNVGPLATLRVDVLDVSLLVNSRTQKLLVYLLDLARRQGYPDRETLGDRFLYFRLEDLVTAGIFPDLMSAQMHIAEVLAPITALHFAWDEDIGGERHQGRGVPFPLWDRTGNDCLVKMEGAFRWDDLFMFSMLFPLDVFYSLPSLAARILFYIFLMARQKNNVRRIAETGGFAIPMKSLHAVGFLKDVETKEAIEARKSEEARLARQHKGMDALIPLTKNPARDIKDRLDEALSNIEEGFSNILQTDEFCILPQYDRDGDAAESGEVSMKEFMAHGKVHVSFRGAMLEQFKEIDRATKSRVRASRSKKGSDGKREK